MKETRGACHAGVVLYHVNGRYHRENGPSRIYPDGHLVYCKDDKTHREDGPAVIRPNGVRHFYNKGTLIGTQHGPI